MVDKETNKEYWNYKKRINKEGDIVEVSNANPDVVSDEDGVEWNRPTKELSDLEEQLISAYYRAIDNGAMKCLSAKERKYWKAAFFRWTRIEEIAKKEKVTVNAVTMTLRRAASKLQQEAYKELKTMFNNKNSKREFTKTKLPRQNNDFVTAQGFAKGVREEGKTEFDKHFKEAYKEHRDEIEAFLKAHPECR